MKYKPLYGISMLILGFSIDLGLIIIQKNPIPGGIFLILFIAAWAWAVSDNSEPQLGKRLYKCNGCGSEIRSNSLIAGIPHCEKGTLDFIKIVEQENKK